jgi:hypothetical protein
MNPNHKVEKPIGSKLKYLMDAESVAKEKRYKLGAWLHGEHREQLKKSYLSQRMCE